MSSKAIYIILGFIVAFAIGATLEQPLQDWFGFRGLVINTTTFDPNYPLDVNGTARATAFSGDGTGLTGLELYKVGFFTVDEVGPTDALDVDGYSTIIVIAVSDVNSPVTLGGTVNADPNDRLLVIKDTETGSVVVEHQEGTTQEFDLAAGSDETMGTGRFVWSFYFDGIYWKQITEGNPILTGTDPDVSSTGDISVDTDAGGKTNDVAMRVSDGSKQMTLANTRKTFFVTVADPENSPNVDYQHVWANDTGYTFVVDYWYGWSNVDDYSLEIKEQTDFTDATTSVTIDAVEIATDGTSVYTGSDSTISNPNVESGSIIFIDADAADAADYYSLMITGYFLSDVP